MPVPDPHPPMLIEGSVLRGGEIEPRGQGMLWLLSGRGTLRVLDQLLGHLELVVRLPEGSGASAVLRVMVLLA